MSLHMTSNTTPPPLVASASTSVGPGFEAFRVFDSDSNYAWLGLGPPQYVQIDLGPGASLHMYTYTIRAGNFFNLLYPARTVKDWTIEGSNDGGTWDLLDTQVNQSPWYNAWDFVSPSQRTYTCDGTNGYRYFKMNITANQGDPDNTSFSEWNFGAPFNLFY